MPNTESNFKRAVVVKRTILGYELNAKENVYANYLIPSVISSVLYILNFAADFGVVYRHYCEGNPLWASLTLAFMYLPVVGCFVMVTSSWELWPVIEGCDARNFKWLLLKILEHLFFPIWSVWRYAEKTFWSIEALMAEDEDEMEEALECVNAPRTVEFYFFLQAFLQAIPQVILQIQILMRDAMTVEIQTINVQSMSIVMNLIKVSMTTTCYQRFKTQKLGGKEYPWHKYYKQVYYLSGDTVDSPIRRAFIPKRKKTGIIYATKENSKRLKRELESANTTPLPSPLQRRTSSDLYLLPSGIVEDKRNDTDDDVIDLARETSVIDGPPRIVLRSEDVTDFPRRLREIKGLPEDDVVGKVISFFWWLCFLIARILVICLFGYFYSRDIIWLLSLHVILVIAFLMYDVQAYVVRRTKAIFFIFIGLVYIFCIIEFKKKFKKTKFIYYGFFTLVFTENLVMCCVWWFSMPEEDDIQNTWWFKYILYVVLGCTFLSISSMIFYIIINKPEKVVVDEEVA